MDRTLAQPAPQTILLWDDLLTTGCHFRAASTMLQRAFPGVPIIGLFIARRVPEAVDFEDLEI